MSGKNSHSSAIRQSPDITTETTLFGEVPLSDSDNNSPGMKSKASSANGTNNSAGGHSLSDMSIEDADYNAVKTKNDLNSSKNKENGIESNIVPYNISSKKSSVAVIDIDGDGKCLHAKF